MSPHSCHALKRIPVVSEAGDAPSFSLAPKNQECSHAKTGTFWKPFSTNYGTFDMLIKSETALLFCRVTDVLFLLKTEQRTKIGRNSTPSE